MNKPDKVVCEKCGSSWFITQLINEYDANQIFKLHRVPKASSMTLHVLQCAACGQTSLPDYMYENFDPEIQKIINDFISNITEAKAKAVALETKTE